MSAPRKFAARLLLLGLLSCLAGGCSQKPAVAWVVPSNPDPHAILNEAQEDAAAGHYENALVKHVWFHENALKIAPAMYGVRLSFALSSWVELGASYPPALEKLKSIRDQAGKEIREGGANRALFNDFECINEYLGETDKTRDAFLWLDSNNTSFARNVFGLAEPALIKAKEYQLCGVYLEPEASFQRLVELYREHKQFATTSKFPKERRMLAEEGFYREAATLVALLVLNQRQDEANQIATQAIAEKNDPQMAVGLAKAKAGEFPPPWP